MQNQSFGRVLWRLLRPHTLTASFVPVLIGSVLAYPTEHFSISLSVMMLLASMLLQSAVNMFNEYYDYRRGLDHEASVGIGGAIVRKEMRPERVFQLAILCVGLALCIGIQIMRQSSWQILPWGLGCIAVGYLYSGGLYPLSATPFGELAAGSCMGLGIIAIAYFIQALTLPPMVFLIAVAPSVMIGAILMANNIRDFDDDRAHGRKTLAVLFGRRQAIWILAAMFLFAYFWTLALATAQQTSPWTLLVLLSLPKAIQAVVRFRQGSCSQDLMPAMVATAQANTLFGLLLAIGLMMGM